MPNTMKKRTELGCIIVEITIESDGPQTPVSELVDLVRVLRETADNIESITKHCTAGPSLGLNSLQIH